MQGERKFLKPLVQKLLRVHNGFGKELDRIPNVSRIRSSLSRRKEYWKRARRQGDGGGRRRRGGGEWGIVTRSVWGESDCCAPIEAVRIVTNAGATRNFQRDRLLSRQYSGGDHRSIPRKDTTQPLSNEKECDAS